MMSASMWFLLSLPSSFNFFSNMGFLLPVSFSLDTLTGIPFAIVHLLIRQGILLFIISCVIFPFPNLKSWWAYLLFIVVSGQIWDLQPIAMSNPSSPFSPVHTYKRNIGARIWDFWAGTLVGKSCVGIFRTLERISSMEKKRIGKR